MFAAALTVLKALDPRIWIGLLIALAIAAAFGWTYHAGWSSCHAEHIAYVEKQQAVVAQLLIEQRRRQLETERLIKEANDDKANRLAEVGAAWAADHAEQLRRDADRDTRAKSAPVESRICGDAAKDQGLSDAIQEYLDGVRAEARQAREGIAGLLEQAQRQTEEWVNLQEVWSGIRRVNGSP